jgi:hypothetical protein
MSLCLFIFVSKIRHPSTPKTCNFYEKKYNRTKYTNEKKTCACVPLSLSLVYWVILSRMVMSSLFQLLALVNQYLRRVPKFERGRVLNAPKHILALVAHCSSARVKG